MQELDGESAPKADAALKAGEHSDQGTSVTEGIKPTVLGIYRCMYICLC